MTTKKLVPVAVLAAVSAFYCVRLCAAPSAAQAAVKAEGAAKENGLKAWWNKWFGKSKEKTVQVLEDREEFAEKAKDKGEKVRGAAEKMAVQAAKQRKKGNVNAAKKLKKNANRLSGFGETLKNKSEELSDKGGDMLKSMKKHMNKKK